VLRLEGLENRQLLSVAPSPVLPYQPAQVSSLMASPMRQLLPAAPLAASLASGYMCPVSGLMVTNRPVPVLDLGVGDTGMVVQMDLRTLSARDYARVSQVLFVNAEGSDRLTVVDEFLLKADLNGNPRDGCESTIAKASSDPVSDVVIFDVVRPVWTRPGKALRTEVIACMGDDLSGEKIGLECAEVVAYDLRGRLISNVRYVGAPSTLHNIEYPQADLFVALTGPSEVPLGELASYTVTVGNSGPATAVNGKIEMPVPVGASFVSQQSSVGWVDKGDSIAYAIPSLASGQVLNANCTFDFSQTGGVDVSAFVSFSADPNPSNNLAEVRTEVVAVPVKMTVTELLGPAADTAVEYQKNITINRFNVMADAADLLVTNVIVDAAEGSLLNGQNYSLWVDTDGDSAVDTVLDSGKYAQAGMVRFDTIAGGGYVVPEEQVVRMEIHMDVASSLTTPTLRCELAGVEVERLDNGSSVGWQIDHSVQTLWSFRHQGDLYVTLSGPTPDRMILGGQLSEPVLVINLRAEYEPVDVTRLQISVMNGTMQSIDSFRLYKDDGTMNAFASAVGVNGDPTPAGYTTFQAVMQNRQLVIPPGQDVKVLVRASVKSDVDGGVSGEQDQFFIAGQTCVIAARGVASSNNLAANDGDSVAEGEVFVGTNVAGPNRNIEQPVMNTVVMSKITSIANASLDVDGSVVPVGSDREIGVFQFVAAANVNTKNAPNRAILDTLTFVVDTVNVGIDPTRFNLVNRLDASVSVAATTVETTATGYRVTFTNLRASAVDTVLGSGMSATFALRANIFNPNTAASSGGSSSLQATLDLHDGFFGWFDEDFGSSHKFDWVDYPDTVIRSTLYQG